MTQKHTGHEIVVHHPNQLIQTIVPVISNPGYEHTFVSGRNTATKKLGWRPIDMKDYDPVDPLTTVHDCFEHFPHTEVGGVQDEFLAQGAMMRLRLEGGWWGPFHTSKFDLDAFLEQQVPGAWGMLFATVIMRRLPLREAPVIEQAPRRLPTRTEGVLVRILAYADSLIGKKGMWGSFESKLCNLDLAQQTLCREAVMNAGPWLRLGHYLAGLRYEGLDMRRMVDVFRRTVGKVQQMLAVEDHLRLERRDGETSAMKLRINPEKYETDVTLCMRTLAPALSVAEQDKLDELQDDELVNTFTHA